MGNKNRKQKKQKSVTLLRFNRLLYSKKALHKAVKDYSGLAHFDVDQGRGYFNVAVQEIEPEVKKDFIDEFQNYVLGLTKQCL